MFSELPKLFERNFAMAFFMPVIIFVGVGLLILEQYQFSQVLTTISSDTLIGVTLLGLGSWLGGIILLASNHDLYRLLEGYGKYNPVKLLEGFQRRRFLRLTSRLKTLNDEYRKAGSDFPAQKRTTRNKIIKVLAEHFPDDERWLLPTAFGNTLRAFETYPRVMYGLEAIDGWSRILAVVPEDYRKLIDNAKTQVDFWVNLGFLSMILIVEYVGIAIYANSIRAVWLFALIVLSSLIAPYRAKRVAIEWGDLVKAVFDLYRFDLLEAMHIDWPEDREEERELWTKISQSIIYKMPSSLPELKTNDENRL
jgi:hypothetical protein